MKRIRLSHIGALVGALAIVGLSAVGAFAAPKPGDQTAPASPPQPHAQKHDSNTLHKIGKALQYSTRKDTENLTTDVHRGIGHKSVVRNRKTGNNFVVKPGGQTVLKSTTNPRVKRWHRMTHRRHRRHHMRRHHAAR